MNLNQWHTYDGTQSSAPVHMSPSVKVVFSSWYQPSLLAGFLLNKALSRDWASALRNWGIPRRALQGETEGTRLKLFHQIWREAFCTATDDCVTTGCRVGLFFHLKNTHFRIRFMVSLRSFPWNGSAPVSISNWETNHTTVIYMYIYDIYIKGSI